MLDEGPRDVITVVVLTMMVLHRLVLEVHLTGIHSILFRRRTDAFLDGQGIIIYILFKFTYGMQEFTSLEMVCYPSR